MDWVYAVERDKWVCSSKEKSNLKIKGVDVIVEAMRRKDR